MRNYSENALYLGRLKMQIVCVVFPLFNLNLWSVRNDLFRSQNTRINQSDYLKYNFGNRLLAERRNRLLVCSEWATGFEIDTIWTGRPTSLLWVALSLTVYAEKEQRAGVLLRKMQTKKHQFNIFIRTVNVLRCSRCKAENSKVRMTKRFASWIDRTIGTTDAILHQFDQAQLFWTTRSPSFMAVYQLLRNDCLSVASSFDSEFAYILLFVHLASIQSSAIQLDYSTRPPTLNSRI